ncbi:hypothetical protein Hanom_Chr15g01371331 [Helianthus anomalus]
MVSDHFLTGSEKRWCILKVKTLAVAQQCLMKLLEKFERRMMKKMKSECIASGLLLVSWDFGGGENGRSGRGWRWWSGGVTTVGEGEWFLFSF